MMNSSFRHRCATGGVLLGALLACSAGAERNADSKNKREKTMPTTQTAPKHTNRLIHATSPYLLQHAHNPVDWYEWGSEAFAKAIKEDKPIFLSIGYSACHWCHVMEHESFENEGIAAVLNDHFVCIKVDREERPDVDEIYMQATMGMNQGRGGWPMSVFLLPDRSPFFAGTYFPPQQFTALLTRVADVWKTDRDKIAETGKQMQDYLARWAKGPDAANASVSRDVVSKIAKQLSDGFDSRYGGLDSAGNKFPPTMAMELMLREYARTGDSELLQNVERTLDQMACGGIYDHLGGGICRYSTDPRWLVPHFEKMLYDQALVSGIYIDAYQVTRKGLYARTAADIFDYVIGDLQSAEGGFYSTRDADSEGMEGKYYIWTLEQIQEVLGQEDAELFCAYYDVTKKGNWDERFGHAPPGPKNILNIQTPPDEFAKARGLSPAEFERRLAAMRAKMLEARSKRVLPGLDDKILTGWNGLMIASLAKGSAVLGEDKYAAAAAKAADFVLANLQKDGRLLRTYRNGQARLTAYLNDYAFMIEALLNLYEATSELKWLNEADRLNDVLIEHYFDKVDGGFFFTADDAEQLIARSKNPRDGAIPSGNSVQALNLLRLAVLLDRKDYREKAESIFRAFAPMVAQSPGSFERLLCAVDFQLTPTREVVIVGSPDETGTRKLLATAYARYIPNKVVVLRPDGPAGEKAAERIPLLRDRSRIDGKPTAYVCENYACKLPVTAPADLAAQLEAK